MEIDKFKAVISELQEDLRTIGYKVPSRRDIHYGKYDKYTSGAVDRFKRHFLRRIFYDETLKCFLHFPGQEKEIFKQVDKKTARAIKDVAEFIRREKH